MMRRPIPIHRKIGAIKIYEILPKKSKFTDFLAFSQRILMRFRSIIAFIIQELSSRFAQY